MAQVAVCSQINTLLDEVFNSRLIHIRALRYYPSCHICFHLVIALQFVAARMIIVQEGIALYNHNEFRCFSYEIRRIVNLFSDRPLYLRVKTDSRTSPHRFLGQMIRQSSSRLSPHGIRKIRTNVVGSKSFRPDIQKPRQMENAVRDI